MWRHMAFHAVIVLGAVVLAGALTVLESQGLPELLFYSVMLAVLAHVVWLALRAWRVARSERERAAELVRTAPDVAALAAVQDERRRLAEDIASSLREGLTRIRREARAVPDQDPSATLQRIHEESQRATSELRRHLGLLRQPVWSPPPVRTGIGRGSGRIPRRDVLLGVTMSGLATVESAAYSATEGPADWSWWSVALSTLAGATVLGRTVAISTAGAVCGVLYALGAVLGTPIVNGFWSVGSVGVMMWTIAARPKPARAELVAGLFLLIAVGASGWVADRDNVGVMLVVLGVATLAGFTVRHGRRREAAAHEIASAREDELRTAAQSAVTAERAMFARELHDVVSHAVGVTAVQAGAGQVSWPHDPETVRRAIAVIDATAESALAELDRLGPQFRPQRSLEDLKGLVERIRATGTAVELTMAGEPPAEAAVVVYRVVQESLTNVVRHAPGAEVHVGIHCDARGTVVRVLDDGPGTDAAGGRGYGLIGLAERVRFAGGTLEVGEAPERTGFSVEAFLPAHVDAVTP
jgi:signal transduction histidine kinase